MKIYGLWVNDYESNDLIGIFETLEEATRWRNYFLESLAEHIKTHTEEDDDYDPDNYMISTMAHMARNDHLKGRLQIATHEVGGLRDDIKIDNLKLLEWEAKKREKTNT